MPFSISELKKNSICRDTIFLKLIFTTFLSHVGAEVAVLCITKSGEVINYQAFTNSKGVYTVAETMPESDRWDSCLARPMSSFHLHCTRRGDAHSGVKFTYNKSSGNPHTVKPFLYKPATVPLYCS
ncbi:Pollen Ole e 1 allergen and extensin family protein [Zea mays]|uniref:Pollen Ole e 1 allergen and extensin family protein n=1 Tax=Zea mays TaxID=4577 RepID=A0A1D6Q085_MAIZE|nr:Pollen Ole e 1 allergen and extensin family protein [Zea mays]